MPRKFWYTMLLAITLLVAFTYLKSSTSVMSTADTLAVMQTRLHFLESQYDVKREMLTQERVEENETRGQLTGDYHANTTFPPELQDFLNNINETQTALSAFRSRPELLNVPYSKRLAPHLLQDEDSLRLAYVLKSKREYSEYIIGIPHVKRDVKSYLYDTIGAVLKSLTTEDKLKTMIVVMVGETDMHYVLRVAYDIEKKYAKEIRNGLIHLIAPRISYYPDFNSLVPTLGDSKKRSNWRSKQNLDAIYLMAYSYNKCIYYLMIEDDVVPQAGYMTEIRKFTEFTTAKTPNWAFIQFSTTGGIGKLFRSTDLIHFMTYIQLFYSNMPIDWLTESYLADRACNINRASKDCQTAKSDIRPTYPTNLFKHVGLYSSLKGKIQKVKEPISASTPLFFPHDNPPLLSAKSELEPYLNHTIDSAYRGESFFWGIKPAKNSIIEFLFKNPTSVGWYTIRSGNALHVSDKICNAVFEAMPSNDTSYVKIDEFDEFGLIEGAIDKTKFEKLSGVRIRFLEANYNKIIISEIEFAETM